MRHLHRVRIYYEDTDCGGVVYYANYLKYFERARTEFLDAQGVSLKDLMDRRIYFVVAEASLKYLSPGRYNDILTIETTLEKSGPVTLLFSHRVLRGEDPEILVQASVKIACVGHDMKPLRLPPQVLSALEGRGAASL